MNAADITIARTAVVIPVFASYQGVLALPPLPGDAVDHLKANGQPQCCGVIKV